MVKCSRFLPLAKCWFPWCKKCTAKIAESIIWSILLHLLQPEQPPQGKLPSQAIAEIIIIGDKVGNRSVSLQRGGMSCNGRVNTPACTGALSALTLPPLLIPWHQSSWNPRGPKWELAFTHLVSPSLQPFRGLSQDKPCAPGAAEKSQNHKTW